MKNALIGMVFITILAGCEKAGEEHVSVEADIQPPVEMDRWIPLSRTAGIAIFEPGTYDKLDLSEMEILRLNSEMQVIAQGGPVNGRILYYSNGAWHPVNVMYELKQSLRYVH